MVCKYYLPRYVCRVYAWLGCRVTESRVIRGCMARLETRCAGGRERGWKAEANSPSFYPILESECLAPLTLETGCTAGSYTHTHTHHIFLSTPASFATTPPPPTSSSFSTDYNSSSSSSPPSYALSFSPASVSRSASPSLRTLFQPSCQPFSRDHRLTRNVSSWPDWDSFEISNKIPRSLPKSCPFYRFANFSSLAYQREGEKR